MLIDIGTVITAHELDQILAGILIVDTAEISRGRRGSTRTCRGIGAGQTAVDRRMGEEIAEQALAGHVAGIHLGSLGCGHRRDVVLTEHLVVVGLEADVHTLTLVDALTVGVLVTSFTYLLVIMF